MDAFVEMLVPREHDIGIPGDENRLEGSAKIPCAGLIPARGVDGMVEVDDLPPAAGLRQAFLQPGQLLGIERAAVEHEETNTAAGEPAERLIAAAEGIVPMRRPC